MGLGLYVHVPFCEAICNYCNFNRGLRDPDLERAYLGALVREIELVGDGSAADTVYFGGGTPSVLEPDAVARILAAVRRAFDVSTDAEVSLEANPESADVARLAGYRDAGITRLSVGVQSFHDAELVALDRLHSAARARAVVADARAAGVDSVSLDLMFWLPGQTPAGWLASVDAAVEVAPDHVSLYMLELYPNAPLREIMDRRRWAQAPDDDAAEMYRLGLDRLEAAGYRQYEISNVARPGHECRHNLKYWTDGEWLGFGPGAHSTRHGVRWRNEAALDRYVEELDAGRSAACGERRMPPDERLGEAAIMALRLAVGVDLAELEHRYGVGVQTRVDPLLQPFVDDGLVLREGSRVRLSRTGMLVSNEILQVFV